MLRRPRPVLAWLGVGVLAALVLTAVVALVSRSGGAGHQHPAAATRVSGLPRGTVVAFLGDSFTQGTGASAPARRWSSLVAAHYGWYELNAGIGGTGFQQAPAYSGRVAEIGRARPAAVVVAGGVNDLTVMAGDPAAEAAAVDATFAALRAALPSATLIALRPFYDAAPTPPLLSELGREERAAVRAVGGVYVDIGQPLQGRTQDISSDGVHPNDAGHAALASAVERAFARTAVPRA